MISEKDMYNQIAGGVGQTGSKETKEDPYDGADYNELFNLDKTPLKRTPQTPRPRRQVIQPPQYFDEEESWEEPVNRRITEPLPAIEKLEGQIAFLKKRLKIAEDVLIDNELLDDYKKEWISALMEVAEDDVMAAAGMELLKKEKEAKREIASEDE